MLSILHHVLARLYYISSNSAFTTLSCTCRFLFTNVLVLQLPQKVLIAVYIYTNHGITNTTNMTILVPHLPREYEEIVFQMSKMFAPNARFLSDWYVRGHLHETNCYWKYSGTIESRSFI